MSAAPDSATTPQVRTRDGCLTCRKRRRKCDESKPKCKACIDRRLSCRYGLNITFLDVNRWTLDTRDAKILRESAPKTYDNVQFIDVENTNNSEEELESYIEHGREIDAHLWSLNSRTLRFDQSQEIEELDEPQYMIEGTLIETQEPSDSLSYGVIERNRNNVANRDSLARITQSPPKQHPQGLPISSLLEAAGVSHRTHASVATHMPSTPATEYPCSLEGTASVFSPALQPSHAWDSSIESSQLLSVPNYEQRVRTDETTSTKLGDNEKQALLKFYVDEVAPWLDVCTPHQPFGIQIPVLARSYKPLYGLLVAIAALQREVGDAQDTLRTGPQLLQAAKADLGRDYHSFRPGAMTARALLQIGEIWQCPAIAWLPLTKELLDFWEAACVNGFLDEHQEPVSLLVIRFYVAASIFTRSHSTVSLDLWHSASSPHVPTGSRTHSVIQKALNLCSQAFNCRIGSQTTSQTMTATWSHVCSENQLWYHDRQPEMRPIFQSSVRNIHGNACGSITSFPIQLHSSQISFYGAMLYHTTNLFLLQCIPLRMKRKIDQRLMTATWHAVQLCGLSLSNDTRWSWDPLALASLVEAGSLLSYKDQQLELLDHLLHLQELTGWKIGNELERLRRLWSSDYV